MAELELSVQELLSGYPSLPVAPGAMTRTFTPAGASFADGAAFAHTGREIAIVRNANAAGQTVTVTSQPSDKNRTGDITTYSLAADEVATLPMFPLAGWQRPDGKMQLIASATDVEFSIIRVP